MSPIISVIICTHNRADCLPMAIESLVAQRMPKDQYEVIVVDNRSTDSTRKVVEGYAGALNIRYIYEPALGLSYARNAGWRNAASKYIAYLDDDAAACPEWLDVIVETFESGIPGLGCVGGKVEPIWEVSRPVWISDQLVTCLTAIDWSDTPHALLNLSHEWLAGANFAFPAAVLHEVGGFVDGLDRAGKNLLSGGDVFLQKQIVKAGYVCYYQPSMAVRHLTPKSRLNQRWFIRRYYWQGLSDAAMQLIDEQPSRLQRVRLVLPKIKYLLRSPATLKHLLLPRYDPQQFTEKCFAMITVGHIAGLLGVIQR